MISRPSRYLGFPTKKQQSKIPHLWSQSSDSRSRSAIKVPTTDVVIGSLSALALIVLLFFSFCFAVLSWFFSRGLDPREGSRAPALGAALVVALVPAPTPAPTPS